MLGKNIKLSDDRMLSDKALVEWLEKRFGGCADHVVVGYADRDGATVSPGNLIVSQERFFDCGVERFARCDHVSPVARNGTPYTIFALVEITPEAVVRQAWFKDFFKSYQVAALWSSVDAAGNPLDSSFGMADINSESRLEMMISCAHFAAENFSVIQRSVWHDGYSWEQAGHDFWLTRNRHGAGFWDRGLKAGGDHLTRSAHEFGESDIYVGDTGGLFVAENKPIEAKFAYAF